MQALALLAALALAPALLASHPSQRREINANVDGDRALERVIAVENVNRDHSVWRASVQIIDGCGARNRSHVVAAGFPRLGDAKAVQADDRGANEVLGVVYDRSARDGIARLVRLVPRARRCPVPRTLFRYVAAASDAPTGGGELVQFTIDVVELDSRHAGRELRVTELFQTPAVSSSVHRETLYRFARARDAYVVYATNTHVP